MQVTLRKANAIQVAINEALKGLEFNEAISLNEFQHAETEITNAASKFAQNIVRRNNLLNALYEIRKNVAAANDQNGIDGRLADVARFEKDITFFGTYAKSKTRTDNTVLNGKLEKLRNEEQSRRGWGNDEVATSIFTQTDLDQFRSAAATAKKQKQKLQDELLELNVRTQVVLSDQTVATLTEENIL